MAQLKEVVPPFQCIKSPTKQHELQYPRLEDSIDQERKVPESYCRYCLKSEDDIYWEIYEYFGEH